jgi:hypothetical protein
VVLFIGCFRRRSSGSSPPALRRDRSGRSGATRIVELVDEEIVDGYGGTSGTPEYVVPPVVEGVAPITS